MSSKKKRNKNKDLLQIFSKKRAKLYASFFLGSYIVMILALLFKNLFGRELSFYIITIAWFINNISGIRLILSKRILLYCLVTIDMFYFYITAFNIINIVIFILFLYLIKKYLIYIQGKQDTYKVNMWINLYILSKIFFVLGLLIL